MSIDLTSKLDLTVDVLRLYVFEKCRLLRKVVQGAPLAPMA